MEVTILKTLQIDVPEQLAKEVEDLVRGGWFASEAEIARLALAEFVQGHRFELQEKFQRDDILWALDLKGTER